MFTNISPYFLFPLSESNKQWLNFPFWGDRAEMMEASEIGREEIQEPNRNLESKEGNNEVMEVGKTLWVVV